MGLYKNENKELVKYSGSSLPPDSELSETSERPLQNKAAAKEINAIKSSMNGLSFGISANNCLTVTYDDGE